MLPPRAGLFLASMALWPQTALAGPEPSAMPPPTVEATADWSESEPSDAPSKTAQPDSEGQLPPSENASTDPQDPTQPAAAPPEQSEPIVDAEASPEEDQWSEEDAAGFAEVEVDNTAQLAELNKTPSPWSSTFAFGSAWGVWLERTGINAWARAKQSGTLTVRHRADPWYTTLGATAEYDPAYHLVETPKPTRDAYAYKFIPREITFEYSKSIVSVAVGYQTISWGQGLMLGLLDIVAPRDQREPGLTELSALRLSTFGTRFALFPGNHRLDFFIAHENNWGLRSPPFGPFGPLSGLGLNDQFQDLSYADTPRDRFSIDAQQAYFRWSHRGGALDWAFYAASSRDKTGVVTTSPANLLNGTAKAISLTHPRFFMLGHSGAFPRGSLLLFWEARYLSPKRYNIGDPQLSIVKKDEVGGLLGATYDAPANMTLHAEVMKSWFLGSHETPLFRLTEPFGALRIEQKLARETWSWQLTGIGMGAKLQHGWLVRAEISHQLTDEWLANLSYVTFHPGKGQGFIAGFYNHDRLTLSITGTFELL